jgi:biopolymer transport protein ExbD
MIEFDTHDEYLGDEITAGGTGPDLTPMIDMVFILLIFFLLTSVFFLPGIDVQLPQAATGEQLEELDLTISIQANGNVLVNDIQVPAENLLSYLRQKAREFQVKEVILQADTRLPFGDIVDVLDVTRSAGLEKISFMVEQE